MWSVLRSVGPVQHADLLNGPCQCQCHAGPMVQHCRWRPSDDQLQAAFVDSGNSSRLLTTPSIHLHTNIEHTRVSLISLLQASASWLGIAFPGLSEPAD